MRKGTVLWLRTEAGPVSRSFAAGGQGTRLRGEASMGGSVPRTPRRSRPSGQGRGRSVATQIFLSFLYPLTPALLPVFPLALRLSRVFTELRHQVTLKNGRSIPFFF